ncbi:MAG: ABC transporter permease [Chloroflexota bacterium]|nr:MAG: ABC transporter permease [Chloroflexota bacterium]
METTTGRSEPLPVVSPAPRRRRWRLFALREDIPGRIYFALGASFILLILLIWTVVTHAELIDPLFLPSPAAIIAEGIAQAQSGMLWADAGASIYRIVVGWLIATLFAVPIGILMGNFKFFEAVFEPFIDLVRYMPVVALIPLTILWAGTDDSQKFLILFIGTFFQEVLLVMDNVKSVPKDLIKVGYTLGMGRFEVLRDIVLPASLPGLWDTFRITLGWTWTYLVVAELVAARSGLGRRIMEAQRYLATERIIFGILFIGLLGLLTDYFFKVVGARLFRWIKER